MLLKNSLRYPQRGTSINLHITDSRQIKGRLAQETSVALAAGQQQLEYLFGGPVGGLIIDDWGDSATAGPNLHATYSAGWSMLISAISHWRRPIHSRLILAL